MLCEDMSRDCGNAFVIQRTLKIANKSPEARRGMKQILLHRLKRNQSHKHLDLELEDSRSVGHKFLLFNPSSLEYFATAVLAN
jgi:hypothetical protein